MLLTYINYIYYYSQQIYDIMNKNMAGALSYENVILFIRWPHVSFLLADDDGCHNADFVCCCDAAGNIIGRLILCLCKIFKAPTGIVVVVFDTICKLIHFKLKI